MLSHSDLARAEDVARRRNRPELNDAHGFEGDGLAAHLLGCYGEIAAACVLGREWDGSVDTFKARPDVGRAEIRTRSRADYDLIVREDDADERPFLLVNGAEAPPWLEVVGWIWGYEAKRPAWRRAYGGREAAYFVPRSELRAIPRRR